MESHSSISVSWFEDSRGGLFEKAWYECQSEEINLTCTSSVYLNHGRETGGGVSLIIVRCWRHMYECTKRKCKIRNTRQKYKRKSLLRPKETWFPLDNTINSSFSIWLNSYLRTIEKKCGLSSLCLCSDHWNVKDRLIMGLHSARVCLYECAQRKMNEILIHEGKRKLVPWHCFCVLLSVNCEHIVLGP